MRCAAAAAQPRRRERCGVAWDASLPLPAAQRTAKYRPDGITECLSALRLTSKAAVRDVLDSQLPLVRGRDRPHRLVPPRAQPCARQFMEEMGEGVVLLLVSALLSRGLEQVAADADNGTGLLPPLIGEHNYASQVPRVRRSGRWLPR